MKTEKQILANIDKQTVNSKEKELKRNVINNNGNRQPALLAINTFVLMSAFCHIFNQGNSFLWLLKTNRQVTILINVALSQITWIIEILNNVLR